MVDLIILFNLVPVLGLDTEANVGLYLYDNVCAQYFDRPTSMIKSRLIFGYLFSLMIMTSCIIYHPQTTDIPLISAKRDLRLDAGISILPSATCDNFLWTDK